MSVMLKSFTFLSQEQETEFFDENPFTRRTCYSTLYPFNFLPQKCIPKLEFTPITILYGNNGSGKSTLLNIIAERLNAHRRSPFNGSALFHHYVKNCRHSFAGKQPENIQILTSDDVSEYVLDLRYLCEGLDARREDLFEEYTDKKFSSYHLKSLNDYDEFKSVQEAKRVSQSSFTRNRLMRNPDMYSNGETTIRYFYDTITENGIYLMDEPENSLSPKLQMDLLKYITDSAHHFNCQFIIASHSPVLLSVTDAKIYNLDHIPVDVCRWNELDSIKVLQRLFKSREHEF